jgi:hypothetical protein
MAVHRRRRIAVIASLPVAWGVIAPAVAGVALRRLLRTHPEMVDGAAAAAAIAVCIADYRATTTPS